MYGVTEVRGGMSEFGMLPRRLKIEATNPAYPTRLNVFQHILTCLSDEIIDDAICCRDHDKIVVVNRKRRERSKKGW